MEHARRGPHGRIDRERIVGEAGYRRELHRRRRRAGQAFVEVAAAARAPGFASRERHEAPDHRGDAGIGPGVGALAPDRGVDRPVLAIEDVGLVDVEQVEHARADVLVEPFGVGLGRRGFADALVAQADRFLRQRQVVEPAGGRAPDLALLADQRNRVGTAPGGDKRAAAQHGRDQQDQRAGEQHAHTEAAVEILLETRCHGDHSALLCRQGLPFRRLPSPMCRHK